MIELNKTKSLKPIIMMILMLIMLFQLNVNLFPIENGNIDQETELSFRIKGKQLNDNGLHDEIIINNNIDDQNEKITNEETKTIKESKTGNKEIENNNSARNNLLENEYIQNDTIRNQVIEKWKTEKKKQQMQQTCRGEGCSKLKDEKEEKTTIEQKLLNGRDTTQRTNITTLSEDVITTSQSPTSDESVTTESTTTTTLSEDVITTSQSPTSDESVTTESTTTTTLSENMINILNPSLSNDLHSTVSRAYTAFSEDVISTPQSFFFTPSNFSHSSTIFSSELTKVTPIMSTLVSSVSTVVSSTPSTSFNSDNRFLIYSPSSSDIFLEKSSPTGIPPNHRLLSADSTVSSDFSFTTHPTTFLVTEFRNSNRNPMAGIIKVVKNEDIDSDYENSVPMFLTTTTSSRNINIHVAGLNIPQSNNQEFTQGLTIGFILLCILVIMLVLSAVLFLIWIRHRRNKYSGTKTLSHIDENDNDVQDSSLRRQRFQSRKSKIDSFTGVERIVNEGKINISTDLTKTPGIQKRLELRRKQHEKAKILAHEALLTTDDCSSCDCGLNLRSASPERLCLTSNLDNDVVLIGAWSRQSSDNGDRKDQSNQNRLCTTEHAVNKEDRFSEISCMNTATSSANNENSSHYLDRNKRKSSINSKTWKYIDEN